MVGQRRREGTCEDRRREGPLGGHDRGGGKGVLPLGGQRKKEDEQGGEGAGGRGGEGILR